MQVIDWRTQSPAELASWCSDHHFEADLGCGYDANHMLDYHTYVVTDGVMTIARSKSVGQIKLRRGWDHIRRNEAHCFTVHFPLRHDLKFVQNGIEQAASPGEFFVLGSDKPFRIQASGSAEVPFDMLYVAVPAHMFRAILSDIDRFCGRVIPLGSILGQLSRDLLAAIPATTSGDPVLAERTVRKAVEFLLEVVSQVIRAHVGSEVAPIDLQQAHRDRLLTYIKRNLTNKNMDVRSAAKACGISSRYLHMIMTPTGMSFSQYVWAERLDQAKDWLNSREHRHLTIEQIASQVGFVNASHFSRTFRARFGAAPSAMRRAE